MNGKNISFADKIIALNENMHYSGLLPNDFRAINPFVEDTETMKVMRQFYKKFYDDFKPRKFIVGINPSRHGAGITGAPFTDTKRLEKFCGIKMESHYSHEVSSVFMYDMIEAYGGAVKFYNKFFINSPFPLAIIRKSPNGKWVNANYYDDSSLYDTTEDFMLQSLRNFINLGLDVGEVFILGKKNAEYIGKMNEKGNLFGKIIVLEHPRFIQQYKLKDKQSYIDKYLNAFG